jgi:hypothetical protein
VGSATVSRRSGAKEAASRLGLEAETGDWPRSFLAADTAYDDIIVAIRRVVSVIKYKEGLSRDEAIRETAYELGFKRAGPRIREVIDDALRAASRRSVVWSEQGRVYPDYRSIDDYDRERLKDALCSVMGAVWWEREGAIREAARYLGFQHCGKRIRAAFTSALTGLIRQNQLEHEGSQIRRA